MAWTSVPVGGVVSEDTSTLAVRVSVSAVTVNCLVPDERPLSAVSSAER